MAPCAMGSDLVVSLSFPRCAALSMQLGFGMRCERTLANAMRRTGAIILIGNSVVPAEVLLFHLFLQKAAEL